MRRCGAAHQRGKFPFGALLVLLIQVCMRACVDACVHVYVGFIIVLLTVLFVLFFFVTGLVTPQAHTARVNALLRCGGYVWSASEDCTIGVWNVLVIFLKKLFKIIFELF